MCFLDLILNKLTFMKIQEILTDFILQRFKMKTNYFKLANIISHILKYFKLTYII